MSDDVDWPLYNESKPIYHVWNAAKLDVGYGPRATECQFWNGFFPKIGELIVNFFLLIYIYLNVVSSSSSCGLADNKISLVRLVGLLIITRRTY